METRSYDYFRWIQAYGPFAQNWFNCDLTAPDVENVNLEWAVKHCDGISHETGVNGWGNLYDIKPNQKTEPLDLDVNYAMRCEYPHVAVQCLCPEKTPPKGDAQVCGKSMPRCFNLYFGGCFRLNNLEWGKHNYSSPEYCWKLNTIIDRPLGTICSEHAHCTGGLKCSDGVCSTCPKHVCPDRTQSDKLSAWAKTCKCGEYGCPDNVCARKGEGCSPTNLGLGCCQGLKCSPGGMCIEDDCKVDGECTEDDDNICPGYFCLEKYERVKGDGPRCYCLIGQVVNGEGRECYIYDNGVSSNCSISGTFCDVESNTCYRSCDKPKQQIYKPLDSECTEHFECDEGLYCNGGRCSVCQVTEECPEKRNPNFPVCKYGEYECPDCCLLGDDECNLDNDECCLGLKCEHKQIGSSYRNVCVHDPPCKKTGTCDEYSNFCDGYGCFEGTVVYAVGQRCSSKNGQASPNCVGGTFCDTDTKKCYVSDERPRITYKYAYAECEYDFDCDEDLYCAQNDTHKDGTRRFSA